MVYSTKGMVYGVLNSTLKAIFRSLSGILPVYFKRRSDKRTMYVVELENFANAFQLEEEEGGLKPEEKVR